jgi:rRNA processing protein Krr1/Pno1
MKTFTGRLLTFDRKTSNEVENEKVVVEVVETENGYVEIEFKDRNEDTYLRFRLEDLIRAVLAQDA